jgi:hypothetical protein
VGKGVKGAGVAVARRGKVATTCSGVGESAPLAEGGVMSWPQPDSMTNPRNGRKRARFMVAYYTTTG